MFVSNGQFYVFIACVCFGGIGGVFFSISNLFKSLTKKYTLKIIFDIIAFCLLSFLYVLFSHTLSFPSFRAYMVLGVFVGIFIYLKSFHIILAKILKKIYNIIDKKILRKNKSKHDRRKE